MLVDSDHLLVDALGIVNVPTVIWIETDGSIVRPHDIQFADDKFVDFHGIEAAPHLEALRRWARGEDTGFDDAEARARLSLPSEPSQAARTHWRLGIELHRRGRRAAATREFERAADLAPDDWTIRRGTIPLLDGDPFGAEFFELYQDWNARGRPQYYPGMQSAD